MFIITRLFMCIFAKNSFGKSILFSIIIGYLSLFIGCEETETTEFTQMVDEDACGPHGELHDDHCDCDSGYHLSENESSCVVDDHSDHSDYSEHDHNSDHSEHDHDSDHSEHNNDTEPLDFSDSEIQGMTAVAEDGTKVWNIVATKGNSVLSIEIYEAFGGPSSPNTVEIGEAESDYARCGTCIVMTTGCEAHGDHVHCAKTFMPKVGGQLRLDELGDMAGELASGELIAIEFQEVNIGSNYQTVAVENGETQSLISWSFSVQLEDLSTDNEECGGHGQLHGDHCHCDSGYQIDPNDASQCIEA